MAPTGAKAQGLDWTGAYAGGTLGLVTNPDDSAFVSGFAGYDRQTGGLLTGVELEHSQTDIGTNAGTVDNMTRLKLRVGSARGDDLVYGVLGAATAGGSFGNDEGYLVGVGYERRISGPVSLGAELLHHRFDNLGGGGRDVGINTFSMRATYRF